MKRWHKWVLEIFTSGVLLALVLLTSRASPVFVGIANVNGVVQVVRYIPSHQELIRLQSAGVDFLLVQIATYPERFQARDLASFTGNLTLVIATPQAPDSFQADALNELKSTVYLFLQRIPDMYSIDRLAGLKGDVKLYIMSHVYPGNMDVSNMNRIRLPYTLAVRGAFPDAFAADRLNELAASTRLILTTDVYPDQWTVQNTNRIRRATGLFINKTSSPSSSADAEYLSMLNTNFSLFIGRAFSVQWVLDRLLATLEEQQSSAPPPWRGD